MLGWQISVYRQPDGGRLPATATSGQGRRLAVWQTGLGGLEWLDELVKAGKAVDLGGNGYPCRYTVTAGALVPRVVDMPPGARRVWVYEEGVIFLRRSGKGRRWVDRTAALSCGPDEWLLVEAWDES